MGNRTEYFSRFIAPGSDRLSVLREYLTSLGVESAIVPIEEKKHIYINFPSSSYNPQFKIKTLIAHYDRVPDSPGANDNSAAVFGLADFASRVIERSVSGKISNIRIFFTDGEELGADGVSQQGAFGLAAMFKRLGITSDDVYVFDACGRGTTAVLARAGLDVVSSTSNNPGRSGKTKFARNFTDLFDRTQKLLRDVSPSNWMTLPVPYSDNAGFLACGIPAVAVTFLPKEEASKYYMDLMKDKNLEKAVMNVSLGNNADFKFKYQEKMPLTWRLFHTEYDNLLSLTPESNELLSHILDRIAEQKTVV